MQKKCKKSLHSKLLWAETFFIKKKCAIRCFLFDLFFSAIICDFAVMPVDGCLLRNDTLTQMFGGGSAWLYLFDSCAVKWLSARTCVPEWLVELMTTSLVAQTAH